MIVRSTLTRSRGTCFLPSASRQLPRQNAPDGLIMLCEMQAPQRGLEYSEEQLPGVGLFFKLRMSKHFHPRLKIFLTLLLSLQSQRPPIAQSTQAEEKPADTIHGVVINSVTHEPIGRALVYSPDNRFATMTNSEGRFEFTLAQPEAVATKINLSPPTLRL